MRLIDSQGELIVWRVDVPVTEDEGGACGEEAGVVRGFTVMKLWDESAHYSPICLGMEDSIARLIVTDVGC